MKTTPLILASALIAGPAFAGDPAPMMSYAPAPSEMSWTGFYAGLQFGGAFNPGDEGDMEFDRNLDGSYGTEADLIAAFGNNFDGAFDSSFIGGVHAGYDHQFGDFVLGGLLELNFADVSQRQSAFSSTPAFYTEEREFDLAAAFRLRGGYLVTNRLLVYVTGGLAYADVEYDYLTDTPAAVSSSGGSSEFGYVIGAGAEARITENISLGVEYLYTNLGSGNFKTNLSGPAAFSALVGSTNSRGSDRDFDYHVIQAKLTYRF